MQKKEALSHCGVSMNFRYLQYINNYQKLRLLLFFHQHPSFHGSHNCLAQQLYIADGVSLCRDIQELVAAGLLEVDGCMIKRSTTTMATKFINHVADIYNDPLDRQLMLDMVNKKRSPSDSFEVKVSHAVK